MSNTVASAYPITVEASSRPPLVDLEELWRHRSLMRLMASRDVKLRFRQTRFGVLWLVINPLLFTLGYAFLFGSIGHVAVGNHNYFVFTYVGISLWASFSGVFFRTSNCLLGNRELLTHAYFPRLSVPIASMLAGQVDVLISWTILLICLVASGEPLRMGLLLIPVWFLLMQVMACAVGLIVASWTLAFRDLQNITSVVMSMGPIFTPIAYPRSALPENVRFMATINPLTGLLEAMRAGTLGGPWPSAAALTYSCGSFVFLVVVALAIFRRAERKLADVI